MDSSSSSPSRKYAYPSPSTTLNVANFVSTKLSKDNYPVWKTQMNCLIVSQELVGFIDGSISQPAEPTPSQLTNQDYLIWRRTDHLLKGWILGSLSEEVLPSVIHLETSSDIWADLEKKLGPHTSVEQKQSPSAACEERDLLKYLKLYKAAIEGDWTSAARFFNEDEDALRAKITKSSETILHIAVGAGQKAVNFVGTLVETMPKEALSMQDNEGDTALSVAAITDNTKAAKLLVNQNPDLLYIMDNDGRLPIHLAARYANRDTLSFLLKVTMADVVFADQYGTMLLVDLIDSGFVGIALASVQRYPRLATLILDEGDSPLIAIARKASVFPSGAFLSFWQSLIYQCVSIKSDIYSSNRNGGGLFLTNHHKQCFRLVPGINNIRRKKLVHYQAIQLVKIMCEKITSSNVPQSVKDFTLKEALFLAARLGIQEVVKEIVVAYPHAIWFKDENNCTIFQLAIIHRLEIVFKLIYRISGQQRYLTSLKDLSDNNILHLAGKLAPRHKLKLITGPVLQMQSELQWFKEVESFVNSTQKDELNCYGQTPLMVFSAEHKELVVEGENWLKGMANSATSMLISAIIFAATFSIPGGFNAEDDRRSISSKHFAFVQFVMSEAISLFASTTSLLVFLSILTTRFAEEDFRIDLPTRLILGLFSLFISITSMVITFCATLYLIFGQIETWVIVPTTILACIPITSFVSLQFPLFAYLISSTYGPGIFGKHR